MRLPGIHCGRDATLAIPTIMLALGLSGLGADPAEAADAACDPRDQLVCSCEAAGITYTDPEWKACFLGDVNYPTLTQVDPLSSRAFMALNWPVALDANGTAEIGQPDMTAPRTGDWTPVWSTWKSTNQIFRGSSAPVPWDESGGDVPAACAELDLDAERGKIAWGKDVPMGTGPRLLDEYVNPEGHPLLDADGVPVRFDVIFNRQAHEYVTDNMLWDARALEQYLAQHDRLDMPVGTWATDADSPSRRGAIVLKTAWKVLSDRDKPASFHKEWAYIWPVIENGKRTHDCQLKPVGLIGMHIAYKTEQMPDWGWATFEHTDIAPTWAEVGATSAGIFASGKDTPDWMFYRNNQPGAAGVNKPAKTALANTPSRIVKSYPPGYYFGPVGPDGLSSEPCGPANQDFHCINDSMQQFFKGSVFANYILIGTQWRDYGSGNDGELIPEILGNATMESYTQATSSCIGCHSYAAPKDPGGQKRIYDFIFSFQRDVSSDTVPQQDF